MTDFLFVQFYAISYGFISCGIDSVWEYYINFPI